MRHQSIIIIDNFLDNPDEIRSLGGKMNYPNLKEQSNFPGRNSLQRLNIQNIDNYIEDLTNESLTSMTEYSHGKFRLTLAKDEGKAKVHLDNSQWSGILYLTEDEHCQGGTDFYRHNETGLDSTLLTDQKIKDLGWKNREIANRKINDIIINQTNDDACWEHIMRVPMKFNRLLLMRPWLWHTAGPGFGDSYENGRLVYLLFYKST